MLIFDKLKCCFIPICKSGSSSLITHLAEEVYDEEYLDSLKQEMQPHIYRGFLRKKIHKDFISPLNFPENKIRVEEYFCFAFVRNPWHRMVSSYLQFLRWKDKQNATQIARDDFAGLSVLRMMELMNHDFSFQNFVHFVKNIERNHSEYVNHHWRSQSGRLFIEGEAAVVTVKYDFIGRLESVDEDFLYVANKLNLKSKTLPKFNALEEYNYKDFYTNSKLIDEVGEYYTRDVEIFKYEFGR